MIVWLVTLQDAELRGEPIIGFAVVEAPTEEAAMSFGCEQSVKMAEAGRGRIKPHVEPFVVGTWRRVPRGWGRQLDESEWEGRIVAAVEVERKGCAEIARTSGNQFIACARIKKRGEG